MAAATAANTNPNTEPGTASDTFFQDHHTCSNQHWQVHNIPWWSQNSRPPPIPRPSQPPPPCLRHGIHHSQRLPINLHTSIHHLHASLPQNPHWRRQTPSKSPSSQITHRLILSRHVQSRIHDPRADVLCRRQIEVTWRQSRVVPRELQYRFVSIVTHTLSRTAQGAGEDVPSPPRKAESPPMHSDVRLWLARDFAMLLRRSCL